MAPRKDDRHSGGQHVGVGVAAVGLDASDLDSALEGKQDLQGIRVVVGRVAAVDLELKQPLGDGLVVGGGIVLDVGHLRVPVGDEVGAVWFIEGEHGSVVGRVGQLDSTNDCVKV